MSIFQADGLVGGQPVAFYVPFGGSMAVEHLKPVWPERWDLLLRYRLIEIIALWEGRLTTNSLQRAFGIGRQQASKDINAYLVDHAPLNLEYDKFLKGYRPTANFKPVFTRGVADEYLQFLATQNDLAESISTLSVRPPNTEVIAPPARLIRPLVLQRVVRACREQRRLEIVYASMANPEPDTRVIQPHTLVYNGYRWHVRAWCEKNNDFRDFVLTRLYDEPQLLTEQTHPEARDEAWQTFVDLDLVAHAGLSIAQQRLVAQDWGFEKGLLRVRMRAALLMYYLQLFRLHPDGDVGSPIEQPVVIKNHETLRPWIGTWEVPIGRT